MSGITGDDINGLIERIYAERRLPLESGGWTPMNVWIPREEGELLYAVIRELRPLQTVEIGLANGLSTLFITAALEANGAGQHIAIDPFQSSDWNGVGVGLVRHAGLSHRLTVIEQPSHQALPALEQSGFRTQFAFVDGSHLFDYVVTDFLCLNRMLDVGGVIAFDDSDWPAIRKLLRFIVLNRPYDVHRPDAVIEPPPGSPSPGRRLAHGLLRRFPRFRSTFAPAFNVPDEHLRLRGRCVVLRKLGDDSGADSQSAAFTDF
jgi:predicted O-methyltransferase YrrM